VPYKEGPKERLILQLNNYLLCQIREDKNVVLIIDEAQNLSPACLEEIRMLSNLETEKEKLIQIVMVGQPELKKKFQLPQLEQLRQRIRVAYHLSPLGQDETTEYIRHRLEMVKTPGREVRSLFNHESLEVIYRASRGVPRLINMLCEHALLTGFISEARVITRAILEEVTQELNIGSRRENEQIYQSA
jgi:general secretion pathway protein A